MGNGFSAMDIKPAALSAAVGSTRKFGNELEY